jgi:hypothetical protein
MIREWRLAAVTSNVLTASVYVSVIREVGSAVKDLANDLTELIMEVNNYDGSKVLKTASKAVGNGCVGRTIW